MQVFFLIFNEAGFEGGELGLLDGCGKFLRLALGGLVAGLVAFGVLWSWLDFHVDSASEAMFSVMVRGMGRGKGGGQRGCHGNPPLSSELEAMTQPAANQTT